MSNEQQVYTDYIGNEVKVGDYIFYMTATQYPTILHAKIEGFTPKGNPIVKEWKAYKQMFKSFICRGKYFVKCYKPDGV